MNRIAGFFVVPSFYGLIAWTLTYGLYALRLIDWAPSVPEAAGTFLFTIAAYLVATLAWYRAFNRLWRHQTSDMGGPARVRMWLRGSDGWMLYVYHCLGLAGIAWHLHVLIRGLGGFGQYLDILVSDSQLIRQFEIEPYGIYFSYLGWVAISFTALRWRYGRISLALKGLLLLQILGSFLFIDRTRPIWLLFVTTLMIAYWTPPQERSRIIKYLAMLAAVALALFAGIGQWIGKTGDALQHYGGVSINAPLASIYYYLTSGYAYMESVIALGEPASFGLERSLYPVYKLLHYLGVASAPVPQILEFEQLPFPTNVGTFLEPYFADGGYPLLGLAILVHTFGLNLFAYAALSARSLWGGYIWATFCFVAFISYFVPKLVSTPVWLFCFIACASMAIGWMRGAGSRPLAATALAGPLPCAVTSRANGREP